MELSVVFRHSRTGSRTESFVLTYREPYISASVYYSTNCTHCEEIIGIMSCNQIVEGPQNSDEIAIRQQ